jgi:hypothetical protein
VAIKRYTEKQMGKIVAAAIAFCEAAVRGDKSIKIGKVTHTPLPGGRCAQYCREAFEAGLGLEEYTWQYGAADANAMAFKLRDAGYSIGDTGKVLPGDILWRPSGKPGHVAIYLGEVPGHDGKLLIGENTSSNTRGYPRRAGTKFTRRGAGTDEWGTWAEVFRLGGTP